MNRSAAARLPLWPALLPLLLLAACRGGSQARRDEVVPPFVFRSLDLRQQTPLGQPSWELTSPEARYDLRRRLAQASSPRGVIYAGGKPLYRLQADSGTVVSDGEAILLEGHLRVQRLGPQPVLIQASRARWLPRRQLLLIDRHPEAYDRQGRIRSQRARFLLGEDRLELTGQPLLERWERSDDPLAAAPRPPAPIAVQAVEVVWKPGSGELRAKGPLQARRLPPGAATGTRPQTLTADALTGNTLSQTFQLTGAVHFEDSAGGNSFTGREVKVLALSNQASTVQPFEARHGGLRISGTGLEVDGRDQWVRIAAYCRVQQPGEGLAAERCGWNWGSSAVQASGDVLLERSANGQTTRGGSLSGRLGQDGNLRVSGAPGGRVISRFRLPSRPPAAPVPPPRAPEPIVP